MGKLRVTRKVLAGQHGSINEQKQYGDKLLAVRYFRGENGRCCKSVEILIYDYERTH